MGLPEDWSDLVGRIPPRILGGVGIHRAPFVSAANEMGAFVGPIWHVGGA